MSARNYLSAQEKKFESLPSIVQKGSCRGSELPSQSATTSHYNRNVYCYDARYRLQRTDSFERIGTPFSDFFSESETGTPDFRSDESDSSTGSALQRSNAEASRILQEEWDRIERTLYDEDGEKTTRPQMIEECKQWKALHPHLRVLGRGVKLPEKKSCSRLPEYDDVMVLNTSGFELNDSDDERLSQSSNDVTPQNSPRTQMTDNICDNSTHYKQIDELYEPKLMREKVAIFPLCESDREIPDAFLSLLQITPLQVRTPRRTNHTILKSDIASSNWMRHSRPDSSVNCDRNSAKSFVSLDTRNLVLSASERSKLHTSRVLTARHKDMSRLEPLYTPDLSHGEVNRTTNVPYAYNMRKVSLPPLLLEEEKQKVVHSAKKHQPRKNIPRNLYYLDKTKHCK